MELKRLEALERKRKTDCKRNERDLKLKRTKNEEIILVAGKIMQFSTEISLFGIDFMLTDSNYLIIDCLQNFY